MAAFNFKWKYEKLAVVVRVPWTTPVANLREGTGGPEIPIVLGKKGRNDRREKSKQGN